MQNACPEMRPKITLLACRINTVSQTIEATSTLLNIILLLYIAWY